MCFVNHGVNVIDQCAMLHLALEVIAIVRLIQIRIVCVCVLNPTLYIPDKYHLQVCN